MKFLEKLAWVFSALAIAALVLVMIYWKPSPIPTGKAGRFVETSSSTPEPKSSKYNFGASKGGSSSKGSLGRPRGSGGTSRPGKTATKPKKLKYPVKAKNPKIKNFEGPPEFRQKYENYRECWDALQQAEAQFIIRPDGSKVVKIISIEKGSIIKNLKFEVGDEIYSVNGRDFSEFEGDMGDMYNLGSEWHNQLKEETDFQIELNRGGIPMVMTYHIPK